METWPIVSIHDQDTSVILDLFTSVYFYHSLVQRVTATKNRFSILIYYRGAFSTQSKIYDRAFLLFGEIAND